MGSGGTQHSRHWTQKNVSLRNKDRTFQIQTKAESECDILSSYFSTIDWPAIPFPHRHVAAVAVRRFGGSAGTAPHIDEVLVSQVPQDPELPESALRDCGKLIRSDKHHGNHGLMEGTLGAYQIV